MAWKALLNKWLAGVVLLVAVVVVVCFAIEQRREPKVSAPQSTVPVVPAVVHNKGQEAQQRQAVLLTFNSGDYRKALASIEAQLQQSTISPALRRWLQAQLPVALTAVGQLHVDGSDCNAGIAYFNRALQLQPDTVSAYRGLAWCYYRQQEFSLALPHFEAYLRQQRNDVEMLLLYTDLLSEREEYEHALSILTHANSNTLDSEQRQRLRTQSDKLRAARLAAEQQLLMETNSFKISYSRQHEDLSTVVATTLDDALHYYVEHYGFAYPETKIAVSVYPAAMFRALLPNQPHWVDGWFDGRVRVPIAAQNFSLLKLRLTLRHELVHALLAQSSGFRRLPSWFDEGLAQYLSCLDACHAFSFPAGGELLPAHVLQGSFLSLDRAQAQRAYHHSLFLVSQLETDRTAPSALKTIIAAISPHYDVSSDALLAIVTSDFNAFYRRARRQWQSQRTSW